MIYMEVFLDQNEQHPRFPRSGVIKQIKYCLLVMNYSLRPQLSETAADSSWGFTLQTWELYQSWVELIENVHLSVFQGFSELPAVG